MSSKGNISLLHARAVKVCENLLEILENLKARKFSTDAPKETIDLVIKLIKFLLKTEAYRKDSRGNPDHLGRFLSLNLALSELSKCISYFDNAHNEKTPIALSYLIREITRTAMPDAKFLAYPINTSNYTNTYFDMWISDYMRDRYLKGVKIPKDILESKIRLIGFPSIQTNDILNHVLIAHEIGHEFANELLGSSDDDYEDFEDKQIKMSLYDECNDFINDENTKEVLEEALLEHLPVFLHEMTHRCLEELVSDAVSIIIFGPSALFALYEFLISSNDDYDELPTHRNEYYPSVVNRIEKGMWLLNKLGLLEPLENSRSNGFEKYSNRVSSYLDEIRDFTKNNKLEVDWDNDAPHYKEAFRLVDKYYITCADRLILMLKEFAISPDKIENEVPLLVERLNSNIPPNQLGYGPVASHDEIPLISMAILSGWVYKLQKLNDKPSAKKFSKIDNEINDNVNKAIEYILISKQALQYTKKKVS